MKFLSYKKLVCLSSLLFIVSLGLLLNTGLSSRKAHAVKLGDQCVIGGGADGPSEWGGRGLDCAYYSDYAAQPLGAFGYGDFAWGWPQGYEGNFGNDTLAQDNIGSFIAYVEGGLKGCGTPTITVIGCPQATYDTAIEDSFIVNTMTGHNGSYFGVTGPGVSNVVDASTYGVNYAISILPQWEDLVTGYANKGQVEWNKSLSSDQVANLPGDSNCPSGSYSDSGVGHFPYTSDVNTYANDSCDGHFYIVFEDAAHNALYRIDRLCGNVTGDIHALQPLTDSFNLTPDSPKPVLDNPAAPTTATFTSTITSTGTLPSSNITVIPYYYYYLGSSPTKHLIPSAPGNSVGVLTGSGLVYNSTTAPLTLPPGLKTGDRVCAYTGVTPSSGTIDAGNGKLLATPAPGGEVDSAEQCTEIASQPYVSFYGSDINAGALFSAAGVCSGATPSSAITTFTNAAGQGAGEQLAAFATGVISSFNTHNVAVTPGSTAPLAFANYPPATAPPYGNFGSGSCIHDYWGDRDASAPVFSSLIPASDGNYNATSATTTIAGGTVGSGKHVVIYASGNVNITGDITYGSANPSWGSIADIPSLYIVANGDITVAPGVTQLDGVYVAQGHTIYTCGTPPINDATLYNNCGSQLIVNGAFVANEVKLSRTFGNLSNATAGENLSATATTHPCDGVAAASAKVCAAEVFNFGPEVYLSHVCSTTCTTYNPADYPYEYQAILPPIL